MKNLASLCAALAAFGLVACGGSANEDATGSITLSISGPSAAVASTNGALRQAIVEGTTDAKSKIKSVWVEIRDEGYVYYDAQRVQVVDGGSFPITNIVRTKLPAGSYVVSAFALDNVDGPYLDHTLYGASVTVEVSDRQVSAVNLIMQQVVAPGSVAVQAPMISGIAITGTYPPVIGKPVHLAATVSASPSQTYLWTVSCPNDSTSAPFTAQNAKVTDLTLNFCEADATVTFTVSDASIAGAGGSISSTVSFVLPYVPQGVNVSGVTINSWPNITSIRSTTNAAPVAGGTVNLFAAAYDPDDNALGYAWEDNCGGSFSAQNTLTPVWTAPNAPGAICELKLTVTEVDWARGMTAGTNSATFKLQVAPAILTLQPYIDVCTPGVWTCNSVASYADASSFVDPAGALQLVKTAADSSTVAFGPNAGILGVAGMVFESASFNAEGNGIGAGTPRFYLRFQDGGACALDAPVRAGSSFTFAATAACGAGKALSALDIIADMGGQIGSVTITDILVNGVAVK